MQSKEILEAGRSTDSANLP